MSETNQVNVIVGKKLLEFPSYEDWYENAEKRYNSCGYKFHETVAIANNGQILVTVLDFIVARDGNSFPITVYVRRPEAN